MRSTQSRVGASDYRVHMVGFTPGSFVTVSRASRVGTQFDRSSLQLNYRYIPGCTDNQNWLSKSLE